MSTDNKKNVRVNSEIPKHIKDAIDNKRDWMKKVQSGEIAIINEATRRRVI